MRIQRRFKIRARGRCRATGGVIQTEEYKAGMLPPVVAVVWELLTVEGESACARELQ